MFGCEIERSRGFHQLTASADNDPQTYRILVADDVAQARESMRLGLASSGHQLEFVTDGAAAVQAATSGGRPFDLVLMDVQMPILDGLSATRRIRQWERLNRVPRLPILAVTALAGIRGRCLAAGCDEFMTKPIDRRALLAMIQDLGSRRRMATPA